LLKEQHAFLLANGRFPGSSDVALLTECSKLAVAVGNQSRIANAILPKEKIVGLHTLLACFLRDFSGDVQIKFVIPLLHGGRQRHYWLRLRDESRLPEINNHGIPLFLSFL